MENSLSREREHVVDLESGGRTTPEEDRNMEPVPIDPVPRVRQMQNLLGKVWSGIVSSDGLVRGEDAINSTHHVTCSNVIVENLELVADKKSVGDEMEGLLEQKLVKENRKKISPKRAPKPPRPPRGPSLDAADQKLIKEISDLLILKRARNERIKAMKRMKAAKGSSSHAGLFAMIITVIFCILFLFTPGRINSNATSNGSPEPSISTSGGVISVRYYKNLSADGIAGTGSSSPNYIEQVSGSSRERAQVVLPD